MNRRRHRRWAGPAALAAAAGLLGTPGTAAAGPPSRSRWLADVRAAMAGSEDYLHARAGDAARPAVVLDIDNTSLQSYYQPYAATPPVLRFARRAVAEGYTLLFVTGRTGSAAQAADQLRTAGYRVDHLCLRSSSSVPLATAKSRCRADYVADGYRILADVGNNPTDFVGGHTGRRFRLPNYGGVLA